MTEDKNRNTPDTSEQGGEKMSEAEIDRNLIDSFPASDPPSWTLGTDHRTETIDDAVEDEPHGERNEQTVAERES